MFHQKFYFRLRIVYKSVQAENQYHITCLFKSENLLYTYNNNNKKKHQIHRQQLKRIHQRANALSSSKYLHWYTHETFVQEIHVHIYENFVCVVSTQL